MILIASVACMRKVNNTKIKLLFRMPEENRTWETGVDGRIILKWHKNVD
jgi:hypothetical protein